jgi:hypothetical protein
MTFAEHPSRSPAQAVALALKIARTSGNSTARERVAEAVFCPGYDAEFRQQIVDTITGSTDQELKEALVTELAKARKTGRNVRSIPAPRREALRTHPAGCRGSTEGK